MTARVHDNIELFHLFFILFDCKHNINIIVKQVVLPLHFPVLYVRFWWWVEFFCNRTECYIFSQSFVIFFWASFFFVQPPLFAPEKFIRNKKTIDDFESLQPPSKCDKLVNRSSQCLKRREFKHVRTPSNPIRLFLCVQRDRYLISDEVNTSYNMEWA